MSEYRKPTYNAASNMAKLVYLLATDSKTLTLEEIMEELEISERTVRRYRKNLDQALCGQDGEPLIQVSRKNGIERWKLVENASISASQYHLMSLYMGSILMSFLQGTIIRDGLLDILGFLEDQLPRNSRKILENHQHKFFYAPFGKKEYEKCDDEIDLIIRGLVFQYGLEFDHTSPRGKKRHTVLPYTLLMYRDSLYLVGFSLEHEEIRQYKVECVKSLEIRKDLCFEYPEDYSPEDLFSNSFGIFIGNSSELHEVEIEFEEHLYDYVANRRWISNQRVTPVKDGKFRMTAKVSDLFEIAHWVMGVGGDAKVINPEILRNLTFAEYEKSIIRYK